jgi:hypothetical protein
MPSMLNPARRTMNVWLVITLLAVFGVFAPTLFGMDGFDGGFALATFSFLLAVTGLVVIIMYRGRARMLDSIFKGEGLLVHWRYRPEEWQDYSEKDYLADKQAKWGLYRVVMVITIIVTFGFWLFHRDSGGIMVGVFLGLGALLGLVVWFTTNYDHWQNRRYQGEVYLARDGVYVGRRLHLWKGWGASLDDLNYNENERRLELTYSMPSRMGRDSATVRIEVPQGEEAKAREVLAELGRLHRQGSKGSGLPIDSAH